MRNFRRQNLPVNNLLPAVSRFAALGAAPTFVALSLTFGFDPVAHQASQPLIHRLDGYVGSRACESCHP
ncbi:MAG TPA: hypothetical protein VMX74_06480, partial [Pirellulales bacterium]|nr:hypothetical protein [Pirellulales bacterium]